MTAEEKQELEKILEDEDKEIFNLSKYNKDERERIKDSIKAAQKAAHEYVSQNFDLPDTEPWQKVIQNILSDYTYRINPDKIPADLMKDKDIKTLADQIRKGDIQQARETVLRMPIVTLLKLRKAFEDTPTVGKYKNVPIEVLSDYVTFQIFNKQVKAGTYKKDFKRGNKVIATLDYDIEYSKAAEKLSIYEKIVVQSVFTLMINTGSKMIDGAQLYRIMTNDPEAKLTPRTIENILHSIDLMQLVKIKCARINVFDDPEIESKDIYKQIFKYERIEIDRKKDETPKNFRILMTELPAPALFANELRQISERPFGFYQLPIGRRATKKNLSLIYELLRLVTYSLNHPDEMSPNLDALLQKCGFDITDRDETKKARDLITAILKGREDTKRNRERHPEIVIENYAGFEWKTDKRSGKRTNIKIKNTGIKGDATLKNTGIKGDALPLKYRN